MKVVVADTSPINYLICIGEVDLLRQLFSTVVLPDAVAAELRDPDAPAAVAAWAADLPPWIDLRPTPVSREVLPQLDEGERAAILLALAEALKAPVLLLIDDADGRAEAERRGIPVTGTLGVLRAAAMRNLTDLRSSLHNLAGTSFRCSSRIIGIEVRSDSIRDG